MGYWFLSASLEKLREQINSAAPRRSKVSDGSIGDADHSSRTSDHNPSADGSVNAIDVTHDPAGGFDGHALRYDLVDGQDWRLNYVIFDGAIYSRVRGFRRKTYTGRNQHRQHVHVSIRQGDAYEDDRSPWSLPRVTGNPPPTPAPPPLPAPAEDSDPFVPTTEGADDMALQFIAEPELKTEAEKFGPARVIVQDGAGVSVTAITGISDDHPEMIEKLRLPVIRLRYAQLLEFLKAAEASKEREVELVSS